MGFISKDLCPLKNTAIYPSASSKEVCPTSELLSSLSPSSLLNFPSLLVFSFCPRSEACAVNTVFVSTASLWEIAIKASLGKLELQGAHTVQELVEVGTLREPSRAVRDYPGTPRGREDFTTTPP